MAIAGSFRFSYAFACIPSFMIVGAIIQGTFPRLGRVLICGGAIVLSYWVFVVDVSLLIETGPTHHLGQFGLTLASVLLVALCDYAIAIEEIRIRRADNRKKSDVVPFSKNIRWLAGRHGDCYRVNLPHGLWPRISERLFDRGRFNNGTFPAKWKRANPEVWGRCCELIHIAHIYAVPVPCA